MSESYPIRLDGQVKGSVTVEREGLVTRFDARCEDPGRLLRLSVYGDGREGYLGVMSPEKGALHLSRQLSRSALESFPRRIEYVGEAGKALPENRESPKPEEKARPTGCTTIPNVNSRRYPRPRQEERQEEEGLLWYPTGDGGLYTRWQGRRFLAIPMAPYGLARETMVEKRTIQGVDYAVYELEPPEN